MTIFQTERLLLRTLDSCDRASLCETLQDGAAMYAYEHAFSDEEVDEWLARQTERATFIRCGERFSHSRKGSVLLCT